MTFRTLPLPALLFLLVLTGCDVSRQACRAEYGDDKMTTIYLVRHAEKDLGHDPLLLPKGSERADRLREILKNTELAAVFSTNTKRTIATAQPTADDQDLQIQQYPASLLPELAERIRTIWRGKSVLVVGHSNTTPALANLLIQEEDRFPRFSELDYTNLYVVNIPRIGKPRVLRMRY